MRLTSNFSYLQFRFRSPLAVFWILFLSALVSCGQQDDQREFEREAYSSPENFTETQNGNEIVREDPDDWRIAPFFEGLVDEITPAWPNPVQSTDAVNLQVTLSGTQSVTGLTVFSFNHETGDPVGPLFDDQGTHDFGILSIQFNANELFEFSNPESKKGLYRVILYDRNRNVISYGDIMVN